MSETVNAILKRRSIRKFTEQIVDDETIRKVLACGMSGPSAVNARDWSFIVVNDREELKKWAAEACGRAGKIVEQSAFSVLICADLERSFKPAPEYWVINGSIAGQNMILAATDLGLGSVWLGIWPQQDKVDKQKSYFDLPETIQPHSIISFGYPAEENDKPHLDYEESRVHFNRW
ncbi:MAG: nitroreductase family protein [Erysipelotrichaceae bacterium]|nr:nitroreductase family protein [Erysipelotrichaceae bacterium]